MRSLPAFRARSIAARPVARHAARLTAGLVAALAIGFAVMGATACNTAVDVLPPLGTDPTAEELSRHAARYCSRLEVCAPDQATTACLGRMTEHDDTPGGRRSSARMWNAFSSCMTLDCPGMSACFAAKTMSIDQPRKPHRPRRRCRLRLRQSQRLLPERGSAVGAVQRVLLEFSATRPRRHQSVSHPNVADPEAG